MCLKVDRQLELSYYLYIEDVIPNIRKNIDDECADLLSELVEVHQNPPEIKNNFNIELFIEYLKDHPDGAIKIHMVKEGYPIGLKDRDPSNLCKKVRNIVRSKRELRAVLKRMLKETKNGQIYPTEKQLHYQLNLLCVPKRNAITGEMTEIRVARHGSFSTKHTVSINSKIDRKNCQIPSIPNIKIYIRLLIKYRYVSLRDLKDAFRQILMRLADTYYIQYCIFNLKFRDLYQPYGLASAYVVFP